MNSAYTVGIVLTWIKGSGKECPPHLYLQIFEQYFFQFINLHCGLFKKFEEWFMISRKKFHLLPSITWTLLLMCVAENWSYMMAFIKTPVLNLKKIILGTDTAS